MEKWAERFAWIFILFFVLLLWYRECSIPGVTPKEYVRTVLKRDTVRDTIIKRYPVFISSKKLVQIKDTSGIITGHATFITDTQDSIRILYNYLTDSVRVEFSRKPDSLQTIIITQTEQIVQGHSLLDLILAGSVSLILGIIIGAILL